MTHSSLKRTDVEQSLACGHGWKREGSTWTRLFEKERFGNNKAREHKTLGRLWKAALFHPKCPRSDGFCSGRHTAQPALRRHSQLIHRGRLLLCPTHWRECSVQKARTSASKFFNTIWAPSCRIYTLPFLIVSLPGLFFALFGSVAMDYLFLFVSCFSSQQRNTRYKFLKVSMMLDWLTPSSLWLQFTLFTFTAVFTGAMFYLFSPQVFVHTSFCCGDDGTLIGRISMRFVCCNMHIMPTHSIPVRSLVSERVSECRCHVFIFQGAICGIFVLCLLKIGYFALGALLGLVSLACCCNRAIKSFRAKLILDCKMDGSCRGWRAANSTLLFSNIMLIWNLLLSLLICKLLMLILR